MRMLPQRARGSRHTLDAQDRNRCVRGNLPCVVEPRRRNCGRGGLRRISDDGWLANARSRCPRPDSFCPPRQASPRAGRRDVACGPRSGPRQSPFVNVDHRNAAPRQPWAGCGGAGSRGAIRPAHPAGGDGNCRRKSSRRAVEDPRKLPAWRKFESSSRPPCDRCSNQRAGGDGRRVDRLVESAPA